MWFQKNKWKILIPILVLAVLATAFYYGGNAPGATGWSISEQPVTTPSNPSSEVTSVETNTPASSQATAPTETETASQPSTKTELPNQNVPPSDKPAEGAATASSKDVPPDGYVWKDGMLINSETGKDKYLTDPVPDGKPLPVEPQGVAASSAAYTCTLSISCSTIRDHMDLCNSEKKELVPEDGWILKPTEVTFYAGESVFNVLQRTCKQQKIHMEFENTPIYNSAYIEGISNLYEFDVGELSGWMYKVNDWFPNYGCSRYQLKAGDVICWVYTCNLGYDVGGGYAAAG